MVYAMRVWSLPQQIIEQFAKQITKTVLLLTQEGSNLFHETTAKRNQHQQNINIQGFIWSQNQTNVHSTLEILTAPFNG